MECTYICKECGAVDPPSQCSGCKEVHYCDSEHQTDNWKSHKRRCRYARENPQSILIELPPGRNADFQDRMIDHIFSNKKAGMKYVLEQSEFRDGNISRPLKSKTAEYLGYDLEMHCSGKENLLDKDGNHLRNRTFEAINGPAVALGTNIFYGTSCFNGINGRVFITGRNHDGKPLTSQHLHGILRFIWAANQHGNKKHKIMEWKEQYNKGQWPPEECAWERREIARLGVDIYSTDPRSGRYVTEH